MSARYVAFAVGAARYCLPISEVQQIVRHENVTDVPQAPRFVEGVINLRGQVIPVIDMRQRLGVTGAEPPRKSRVIIVDVSGRPYGLHVDDVREIVDVEDTGLATSGLDVINTDVAFVRAIARVDDQMLIVLNLAELLGAARPGAALGREQG
jgi:purine-binding chemotaxis protein CheW